MKNCLQLMSSENKGFLSRYIQEGEKKLTEKRGPALGPPSACGTRGSISSSSPTAVPTKAQRIDADRTVRNVVYQDMNPVGSASAVQGSIKKINTKLKKGHFRVYQLYSVEVSRSVSSIFFVLFHSDIF